MSTSNKDNIITIPKLSQDGSNWVTFKTHFLFAMAAHNIVGHFERSDPHTALPTPSTQDQDKWTTKDQDEHQTYPSLAKRWKHDVFVARDQLAQVVSNSLLIYIQRTGAIADMWHMIVVEFNRKYHMAQVNHIGG